MARPKGPSPESIKRIYAALWKGPKSSGEIRKQTKLHGNTIGSTMNDLVNRKMVRWRKMGHKTMYEMVKTKPPEIGWEIPWIELMMTKEDWKAKWDRIDKLIRKDQMRIKWEKMFNEFAYEVLIKGNPELVKVLEETGLTDVPLQRLKENLDVPYCLECLTNHKQFHKPIYSIDTGEFSCPNCGLVVTVEHREELQKETEKESMAIERPKAHGRYSKEIKEIKERIRKHRFLKESLARNGERA